jgi:hypothetical protein
VEAVVEPAVLEQVRPAGRAGWSGDHTGEREDRGGGQEEPSMHVPDRLSIVGSGAVSVMRKR